MPEAPATAAPIRIANGCGLSVEINANGSLHRLDAGATCINLFPGNELEGGPANLYLRRRGDPLEYVPLLGPTSPTRFERRARGTMLLGCGQWGELRYSLALALAEQLPAWSWCVWLENQASRAQTLDLIYAQDLGLAPYGMIRTNEFYVSQYMDHTPLTHALHGVAVASRQNLPIAGAHPWCIIASRRKARAFATDALQFYGLAMRAGRKIGGLHADLPTQRLQHEHSLVALQDEAITVPPQGRATLGFVGRFLPDHPAATSAHDLRHLDEALAAAPTAPPADDVVAHIGNHATHFSTAALLPALDLTEAELDQLFGKTRAHVEVAADGTLLSFFHSAQRHVVLRAKELQVLRPHGHILRTGARLVPAEAAQTSTTWMAGVFHSMLTQGHVSINRCLSTVRSYLNLFRSQGTRIFVEHAGSWQLLEVPSAFEIAADECRWFYKHANGLIEICSRCAAQDRLILEVRGHGSLLRVLIAQQLAVNGEDSNARGNAWQLGEDVAVTPDAASELGRRFPDGRFRIRPGKDTVFERVGGDELLFLDGRSRALPHVCIIAAGERIELQLIGELVAPAPHEAAVSLPQLALLPPPASPLHTAVQRLNTITPWLMHNALIHYLAPRGLEQFSGGGWGTRDVCQGPVELLLALGATQPVRDLLLHVMRAQNADGDWPQWFMFFERERTIRAADAHGDIVFWPVLALAQYLIATGDATLLEERVGFFDAHAAQQGAAVSVWEHVQQALHLIHRRRIAGTALAAYGHGDWNDSLQPADPSMRDHMCSAWTVTLHHQMLTTLAQALRALGRSEGAARLEAQAREVQGDFQRLLLVDGVLAGYALFTEGAQVRYLLHPRDTESGVHYSALAMIHAILEGMFTPDQAHEHLRLLEQHASGPDGIRLFDRPLPYHGGPQRFFQRAETATFFGREIGLMYMHAHLRYAQALAQLGEAERFFHALCQVNPIGIRELVPTATLRQSNCYYSSSDAAFVDRQQASREYRRVRDGHIALEGGWRVYSSGPGIAVALLVRHFLGLTQQAATLRIDPVIPPALDGLRASVDLWGRPVQLEYAVRAPGCGVRSVLLNGRQLQFTCEPNPYRRGAALLAKSELDGTLGGTATLHISIGGVGD